MLTAAGTRFPKSSFGRNVSVLAGGTVAGQILVVGSTPVITRLYTPHQMGELGLFISFLSVAALAVTLRYEMAIPAAGNEKTANTLFLLALLFAVPVSCLGSVAMFAMIRFNLLSFGMLETWTAVALFPALLSMGSFSALRFWLVRNREFGGIGRVMVLQGGTRAVVPIGMAALHLSSYGLFAGEILGRSVGVLAMLRRSLPVISRMLQNRACLHLNEVARKFWKFPLLVLPSSIVDVTALALPVPLIAHYYGVTAAGLFLLVQRLTFLPASLISASIADVFHSRLAECLWTNPESLPAVLMGTTKKLLLYGLVILVPAALLSPLVFGPIFGSKWREAGILVSIIAPWSLGCIVVTPVSRTLVVVHRNEWKLIYDFSALASIIGGILGAHFMALTFREALILLSGLQTAAYILYFLILRAAATRPAHAENVLDLI